MSFLIDTDICSAYLRRPSKLFPRFVQHSGQIVVSTVVLAELYVWAYGRDDPNPLLSAIETLRAGVDVLNFDQPAAEQFGRLRATLLRAGITVAPLDLMVASVALAHNLTVVTHNTNHFTQVPGLRVVDWLAP